MTIFSRFVAAAFARIFLLCLGTFTAIFLVVDFLEKIGRFAGANPGYIALFFLTRIPEVFCQTSAMAVLMATLLTLGIFSMSSELTAMRGCGLSLGRITMPILVIAFIVSLLNLGVNEYVLPQCIVQGQYIRQVLIEKKSPKLFFRQMNIWHRDGAYILKAKLFEPETGYLKGVTLWKMEAGMQPEERLEAAVAKPMAGGWLLDDVVVRQFGKNNIIGTSKISSVAVPLHLKTADFKVMGKYSDNMGIRELAAYCEKLRKGGYDPTRYVAQMHGRISLAFAPLVMAFLGVPFAVRRSRSSGIAVGISASLGIGFGFFILNSIVLSFGQAGVLSPLVSAWATNAIFLMIAIWLALKAEN
ncbi:LPS export ABC transporter permease LptG [Geotalea sp. SG265]|uniref:LPS export ABC transporter permease LptG n=1 Tax=Geotalea sp. SG265 TaxID=2922867 RepID=UPI001FAFA709|nr:LPS export ABC transporter permease LptG [Geotalea sp. SG265]